MYFLIKEFSLMMIYRLKTQNSYISNLENKLSHFTLYIPQLFGIFTMEYFHVFQ